MFLKSHTKTKAELLYTNSLISQKRYLIFQVLYFWSSSGHRWSLPLILWPNFVLYEIQVLYHIFRAKIAFFTINWHENKCKQNFVFVWNLKYTNFEKYGVKLSCQNFVSGFRKIWNLSIELQLKSEETCYKISWFYGNNKIGKHFLHEIMNWQFMLV